MSISLDKMSLMRAFTTKRNRTDLDGSHGLGRAASQRAGRPIVRAQISGPVALVSTSNELYINADDVSSAAQAELASSSHSDEESDSSMLSLDTGHVTPASSVEGASPTTPEPEPNHLSCYFKPAVDTTTTASITSLGATPSMSRRTSFETVPAIPQRMPSHSKKAHEKIHRKRSVQRMMSPPASIRTSLDIFGGAQRSPTLSDAAKDNPFSNELAQLDEVVEDLTHAVGDAQVEADLSVMKSQGLATFTASDYMAEIQQSILEMLEDISEPSWI